MIDALNHMRKIKQLLSKTINIFVPKNKNKIYARPMWNTYQDKYDLLNYGSSNLLTVINDLINNKCQNDIHICIEYHDENRISDYRELVSIARNNGIELTLLRDWKTEKNALRRFFTRFSNLIERFSSIVWLTESGGLYGKLPCQKIVCCNYYISCKNDFFVGEEHSWERLDALITTALLPSNIVSSHLGVRLDKCISIGFPRNDTLMKSQKKSSVRDWIAKQVGYIPSFIFVYAPTVRDDEREKEEERPLFGYRCDGLKQFLKDNKAVIIYKLHAYQNSEVLKDYNVFLKYPYTYDFSFYDLLSVADCLIGDYSSVNFDWLLLDKPIIFNIFDIENFNKVRGLAYDPYSFFCPGLVANNWVDLRNAMTNVIRHIDCYSQQRDIVRQLLFKYSDFNATKRVANYILGLL